ncbi:GNAT family N-acetyltransferase [Sediminicola sp. 1XM1-17]|uniref:GNAT family N-acetyltransferase n=1 Tax=Sediminicola sp. 1XM1-17 TaxID=3127702 RepID=UPI003077435D
MDLLIRKAKVEDQDAIWDIIKNVIKTGNSYVFYPDSSREKMINYWCPKDKHTFVALLDHKIMGTFLIKDNIPDNGSHVANASFMTHPDAHGKGIGYTMGLYSLEEARRLGYRAMQFNMVIKSNEPAVKLWTKLGFQIIGEIPEAFNHPINGYTNAYVMYQKL